MGWIRQGRRGAEDVPGRDPEIASALKPVDPGATDDHYWLRFHTWVMRNAAPELARRRMMADLTVGDVLSGWARTVVPTAMLAAAAAAMLLLRSQPEPPRVTVEDLLVVDLEGESIPAALADDVLAVSFAGESF